MSQPSCTVRNAVTALAGARLGSVANLSSSGKPVSTMPAPFRPGAGDEVAQAVIALRTHDQIDDRRAAQDLRALRLGHAAGNRDDRLLAGAAPRVLHLADAAEIGIDLLGRLLADVAGVEEDDVGVLHRRRLGEAVGAQQLRHALGVVDVHLAAKRLDEDLSRAGHLHFRGAFDRHAVKLQLVADQAEPQLAGHPLLQPLDLLVAELDHAAALDVDQVVVVAAGGLLVAAAAGAEIVALQEAVGLEQLDGAVDGRERDARIHAVGAPVDLLDVGVIPGGGQNAGDDAALARHPQPLLRAQLLYACLGRFW